MTAAERARPDVADARDRFLRETLAGVPLADVVVVDESYVTTKLTRLRGRSPRGERLRAPVPHGHWKVLTVLAAISVAGVVAAATVDAATDGDVFVAWVRDCLVSALTPGRVVVMDNLGSHKVTGVRALVEGAGCRLAFLPPYSPDLSPIEPCFAKAKNAVRGMEPRTVEEAGRAVAAAFALVTPGDCHGFFRGCDYTLHLR